MHSCYKLFRKVIFIKLHESTQFKMKQNSCTLKERIYWNNETFISLNSIQQIYSNQNVKLSANYSDISKEFKTYDEVFFILFHLSV